MTGKFHLKIPSFHRQGRNVYAIIADDKVVAFEKHWRQGDSLNIVRYKTRRMVIKISKMLMISREQYRIHVKEMLADHLRDVVPDLEVLK